MKPCTNHEIKVEKVYCLYVFSDGYTDQFFLGGEKGEKFKEKQLKELIGKVGQLRVLEQEKILVESILSVKATSIR